ncbi:MAG TPA: AMP-binding protein, partial [Rhizomicrobium sp.]
MASKSKKKTIKAKARGSKKAPAKKTPARKAGPKKAAKKAVAAKKPVAAKQAPKRVARPVPAHRPAAPRRSRKPVGARSGRAAVRAAPRPKVLAASPYDTDLGRNGANYQALTPLTFLERAGNVFPERTAIVHGNQRYTYAEFYARSRKLASALSKLGLKKNQTVAAMLANTPPMLEAHYGVPMAGGVLNTLNTRLDAAALAFILDHGEAKILITDREFAATMAQTLALAKVKPIVIDYDDPQFPQTGARLGNIDYEAFIASGDPEFAWAKPADEWDAISLNYTSGTTGNPKGVVFHHRGAALMGYGNILAAQMPRHPIYLWTLP